MEVGERARVEEGERPLEAGVVLAGEARDQVGPDGRVGQELADHRETLARQRPVVAAAHAGEHAVVGRLQRHVQVVADARLGRHDAQERLAHLVRVDRGEAQARHDALLGDRGHQPGKVDPRLQVLAVAAEVHARQDDLLEALLGQRLDLGEHGARRKAAARAARHRHDAEGAEEVAALLHLQESARLPVEAARAHRRDRPLATARAGGHPLDVPRRHRARERVEATETDHVIDGLERRGLVRLRLRVAAGQDDARPRVQAPRAAHEAAALGVGRVGHRARVDDHHVGGRPGADQAAARRAQPVRDGRAVVRVHLAAEGGDRDPLH